MNTSRHAARMARWTLPPQAMLLASYSPKRMLTLAAALALAGCGGDAQPDRASSLALVARVTAPVVTSPGGPTTLNAASFTNTGSAATNTLVNVWVDANRNGVRDRGDTAPVPNSSGPPVVVPLFDSIDWSPDGARITFTGLDTDRVAKLWSMLADGTDVHVVARAPAPAINLRELTLPTWSPYGTLIAFAAAESSGSVIKVAPANGSGGAIAVAGTLHGGAPSRASWSPDGSKLAFVFLDGDLSTFPAFASQRVHVGDFVTDGVSYKVQSARRLTSISGTESDPTWSLDGLAVAYTKSGGGGNPLGDCKALVGQNETLSIFEGCVDRGVWAINLDGTGELPVTMDPPSSGHFKLHPHWIARKP